MKFLKFALLLLVCIGLSCTKSTTNYGVGYTTIVGTIETEDKFEISLYKVENGTENLVSSCLLNDEKQFGFNINPDKEGFYVMHIGSIKRPIYIKENIALKLSVNSRGISIESTDEENKVLSNWYKESREFANSAMKSRNENAISFYEFYENNIHEIKKYHEMVNTPNSRFNELMHALIDLDIEVSVTALNFPQTPEEKSLSFYKEFMKGDNFKTTLVLDLPGAMRSLGSHQIHKSINAGIDFAKENPRNRQVKDVENDTLRGYYLLENLQYFKTYNNEYLSFIEPYRKDIALSKYVETKVADFESKIKNTDPGTQGYPFTYKDVDGNNVSFKDFKGKYVYIDVWATWCGPCKAEIPHLQKLEKELHGKDIQFVSISLDNEKAHDKWKKFVEKKELSGIQLIAPNAFDSRIVKDYKIRSIPRFMLFDKDGVIVDSNAKRPSNTELKIQLMKLLK